MLTRSLLVAALVAAPSFAQCLVIANPPANNLIPLTDDSGRTVALPFAFPFNGTTYTQISICSNGYVWLGANSVWDFSDTEAEFLSQGPRIAPMWDDLNPAAGGGVYYVTDAQSAHVVWKDVPYFLQTVVASMELVLMPNGAMIFHYASTMGSGSSTSITGISRGNNAPSSQLSWATNPAVVGATGYELFLAASFSLTGTTFMLTPTTATDYATVPLTSGLPACTGPFIPPPGQTVFGLGCPRATGTFYEFFAGSTIDLSNTSIQFTALGGNQYVALAGPGFDNSFSAPDILVQGDDTQVPVSTASMNGGNGFPYQGQSRTSLLAHSNGFLWMDSAAPAGLHYTAAEADFATLNARIAPMWADWNFNQGGTGLGGTFYWTATANFCMATWENVAAYGRTGSQNTFQVKLFANGDIAFSYGAVLNNATLSSTAIVGLSGGGSLHPAGTQDLSSALTVPIIYDITPSQTAPLRHTVGGPPTLGATYTLNANNVPAGSSLGAFVLGFVQINPGIDLSGIGMPGCSQYGTNNNVQFLAVSGSTMTIGLPIPLNAMFAGINLTSQAATFSPGANPLGVLTSNGVQGLVGL